ncbi:MAG TPA: type II secretion system F family protein [Candidatus Paceibacterota bacterium]|nr:type II secretion system F family protein [Verrucomicrobiota bacterium]HRY49680.1 type II secretion system F family protein [Candidatus Paceibacterota bacterium]HSA02682.1 type II secretion system F family protein [Candidatus Paceibacterota bacterium]
MPHFSYRARRKSGELVQGTVEVTDRSAALMQIERLGLFPVSVEAAKGGAAPKPERAAGSTKDGSLPSAFREWYQRKRKPRLQELATFTQQLSNLLNAGMPLTVALNSMTHLESKGIPSDVSKQLKQDVTEGRSLSDAMSKQPLIFSDIYVNMVRAGEQSGALVDVLRRLATHFERFAEVQSKFTSAMIYPAIVAAVGVIIVVFFMTVMLPKFMSIFQGMQVELPPATKALMGISHAFSAYWWLMLLVLIALVVLIRRYRASTNGRRNIDEWKMKAPVLGKVVKLNLFAQFARTLSTLLHNGVPVLTALKITEQIISNVIVKEAIARTREGVTDGKTLAQPLAQSRIFPQLLIDLVKIGEDTGDVPGALQRVADAYENELSIALRVLTNLIEPALIIVMALGVGFLLFTVLSTMFAITSNLNR